MLTARQIELNLRKLGSKTKAKNSARFFKTGKGEYGEGDIFLGVTVPEQRVIVKKFSTLPRTEIAKLLASKHHECRLTALMILSWQYKEGEVIERQKIVKFYLAHTKYINNWDLVDASAGYILGTHLLAHNHDVLYKLVRSKNMWERRIAIVSTHALIRAGDFSDTINLAGLLMCDKEDLMHKAVGWMLREVGKQSRPTLVQFLKEYAPCMPRTALRYAIEHFSDTERKRFMEMK